MRRVAIIALFLLSTICGRSGWVITEESKDSHGNKIIQTTFIQDNLIRHETPTSIAIVDLENKLITIVFSQYRVYWEGSAQKLKESSVLAYDKQMEEMLLGLPEDSRYELDSIYKGIREQMLDSVERVVTNDSILVKNTLEDEKLLDYNTVKYNILLDNKVVESVWHTTEIKPYSDINIENMIAFMKQLNPNSGTGNISQTDEYLEFLKSGILLKSVEYMSNGNTYEVNVTNIREVKIIADFFSPPANYHKASFSDILNLMPVIQEDKDNW